MHMAMDSPPPPGSEYGVQRCDECGRDSIMVLTPLQPRVTVMGRVYDPSHWTCTGYAADDASLPEWIAPGQPGR